MAAKAHAEIGKAIFPKIHQPFESSCRHRLSCVFVIPLTKLRVAAAVIFLHFHKFDQQLHLLRQQLFPVLHTVAEHFPNKFFFGKPQFKLTVLHITTGAVERGTVGIATALVQHESGIHCAYDSGGAGQLVERITVALFAQVMHQQKTDIELVRQLF